MLNLSSEFNQKMTKVKIAEGPWHAPGISTSSPFRLHEVAYVCLHEFQKGNILTTNAKNPVLSLKLMDIVYSELNTSDHSPGT